MWGASVACEVYFSIYVYFYQCVHLHVFFLLIPFIRFYKVNVACDCLCLGFHFFNKGPYAMWCFCIVSNLETKWDLGYMMDATLVVYLAILWHDCVEWNSMQHQIFECTWMFLFAHLYAWKSLRMHFALATQFVCQFCASWSSRQLVNYGET
jgi:hypothetical protein